MENRSLGTAIDVNVRKWTYSQHVGHTLFWDWIRRRGGLVTRRLQIQCVS